MKWRALCLPPLVTLLVQDAASPPARLDPFEHATQFQSSQGSPLLADASVLIKVKEARAQMQVTGKGLAAVVIDTGVYADHASFCGRVVFSKDFTGDTRADAAADRDGHGTNVAGIIAASSKSCQGVSTGIHDGMAPEAAIYSLKVVNDLGICDWTWMAAALRFVVAKVRAPDPNEPLIGAVNLSLGSLEDNFQTDEKLDDRNGVLAAIHELTTLNVPVVAAAGNRFYYFHSQPGMVFPAIARETISVGAVFNREFKNMPYGDAFVTKGLPSQIAPFSQRLPREIGGAAETDIFAPGAEITSVGKETPVGVSTQKGTSQAAPMVTGSILLLQQYYNVRRHAGSPTVTERPPIDAILHWLKDGSRSITDNYGDNDNVENTQKSYRLLDVLGAMKQLKADPVP